MSFDAFVLCLLLVATLACFVLEVLPVEVTAMALLAALFLSGLVSLDEALAGLSNKGVVTIGALFVLSHALVKTGFLEIVAARLSLRFAARPWLGVAVLLVLTALISSVLNNTAVVAMTIPLTVDVCRRFRISPSKVLMPLSFAAIFGGTLTLIGTSTNLLVSSIAERATGRPLGMFELTPLGLVFLAVGLAYVLLLAPRWLPDRVATASLTGKYEMASYLTELEVLPDSRFVGRTVRELDLNRQYDVTALCVLRNGETYLEDLRLLRFAPGDVLIVRGAMSSLLRLGKEQGVALLSDITLTDRELSGPRQVITEALISPNSGLIGRTLQDVDFRRQYGGFVLAIRRHESTLRERLARTRLRFSDTLLVVTSRDRLEELRRNDDLILTSELDLEISRQRFWWLPLLLVPAIMALAALEVVDILAGALLSVVALLVLGVITPRESYRAIDWSVILFIATFIPVGDAMLRTGLAELLARAVLLPSRMVPAEIAPWVAVSALYLVASAITETITNNAAAIVLTPVAISMAAGLGVDPQPLLLAVCFAASASFMTPTGYQTNLMVYGPGSYRFIDFVRFGAPLDLLFWLIASLAIPMLWSFSS